MKISVIKSLIILVTLSTAAEAQLYDIQISATRKKIDQQKSRKGEHATVTTKEMAYTITVENRSFKTFAELNVKYMIFYADAQPGKSEKPIEAHQKGSETLKNLSTHRTSQFETAPIKLEKEELDGGWYYSSGGERSDEGSRDWRVGPRLFRWQPRWRICEPNDSCKNPGVAGLAAALRVLEPRCGQRTNRVLVSPDDNLKLLTHLRDLIRTEHATPLHAGINNGSAANDRPWG